MATNTLPQIIDNPSGRDENNMRHKTGASTDGYSEGDDLPSHPGPGRHVNLVRQGSQTGSHTASISEAESSLRETSPYSECHPPTALITVSFERDSGFVDEDQLSPKSSPKQYVVPPIDTTPEDLSLSAINVDGLERWEFSPTSTSQPETPLLTTVSPLLESVIITRDSPVSDVAPLLWSEDEQNAIATVEQKGSHQTFFPGAFPRQVGKPLPVQSRQEMQVHVPPSNSEGRHHGLPRAVRREDRLANLCGSARDTYDARPEGEGTYVYNEINQMRREKQEKRQAKMEKAYEQEKERQRRDAEAPPYIARPRAATSPKRPARPDQAYGTRSLRHKKSQPMNINKVYAGPSSNLPPKHPTVPVAGSPSLLASPQPLRLPSFSLFFHQPSILKRQEVRIDKNKPLPPPPMIEPVPKTRQERQARKSSRASQTGQFEPSNEEGQRRKSSHAIPNMFQMPTQKRVTRFPGGRDTNYGHRKSRSMGNFKHPVSPSVPSPPQSQVEWLSRLDDRQTERPRDHKQSKHGHELEHAHGQHKHTHTHTHSGGGQRFHWLERVWPRALYALDSCSEANKRIKRQEKLKANISNPGPLMGSARLTANVATKSGDVGRRSFTMPIGTIKDGKARQQRDDDGGGGGSDGKVGKGKGKDKEKTGTFDTKTKVAQIPVTFGTVMGTDIFRMEQGHRRNASTGSTRAAPPANQQENSLRKMPSKIFQAFFKSNTSSNAASVENSGGKSARSSTDKDSVTMLHAGHESIVPELPSLSAIQNSASSHRHRRPFIGRGRASSDASFGCKGVSSGMPLMPPQRLGSQGVAQQQQQTLQQLQPQQYQQPRARLPRTYTSLSNSGARKPVPESATTGASTDRSNGESSPRSPAKPVFVDVLSTTPSSTTPTSTKKEAKSGSAANPLFADTPATMPTSGISASSTPTRTPAMPSPPQRAAPSIPTSNPTPAVACLTRYNDFDSDSELESGVELMPPPLFSGERGGYGEVARVRVKREKERERWWDVRDRNTRFYAQICDIFDQYIELTPSDVEGEYENRKGGWEGGDDDDDDDDDDAMSYDFKKLEREE